MPSMPFYTNIAVINQSTVVSDSDGSTMTTALNLLLPQFCKDWNVGTVVAIYVAKGRNVPNSSYKIYLLDTSDVQGALGYHDIIGDVPYAKVFAKTTLNYGGVVLYDPAKIRPTVAQTLSHEAFELIVDPRCTIWWMNPNTGILYAGETGDPVESNTVVVNVGKVYVGLSDWILPSWQDIQASRPYNHLNTLTHPYQVDRYGYVMTIRNGVFNYVFGSTVSDKTMEYLNDSLRSKMRNSSLTNSS